MRDNTHVDGIDDLVDDGDLLGGVGDQVSLPARRSNGKLPLANGGLDLLQEQGEVGDLIGLALVYRMLVCRAQA